MIQKFSFLLVQMLRDEVTMECVMECLIQSLDSVHNVFDWLHCGVILLLVCCS